MNSPPISPSTHTSDQPPTTQRRTLPPGLIVLALGLTAAFSVPLYRLVRFSLGSDLYSHIVLMPVVSGYLIYLRRGSIPATFRRDAVGASLALLFAGVLLGIYGLSRASGTTLPIVDALALTTGAYLLSLLAAAAWILGRPVLRRVAFPLSLLAFMIPFPTAAEHAIEMVLQHGSAEVSYWLFNLAGTPVFRSDLVFQLPGIVLQVAPECSGIHSTLALLITSLVAGSLFLQSKVNRLILSCAVLPLALARNGFRIFTIGELCVHISPDMIHSYIHQQGGPIFFALSLVPFGFLLYFLRRAERRSLRPA